MQGSSLTRLAWAAALVICVVHFGSFEISTNALVTDVRYFVYFAWRVGHGAVPHLDFFDNKTQLAAMVGGLIVPIGEWLGDPLTALRVAFLGLAAAGGLLTFEIHRRIAGDRPVAGLVGVLVFCGFPLVGALAAIGTLPKLLMAVLASVMGLLVYRRCWFWAGVASAFAFLDWQVGGMAGLGACAAAVAAGGARWRNLARVVLGGLAGLAPVLVYLGVNGALRVTLEQTLAASFVRGTATLADSTVGERLARIHDLTWSAGAAFPPIAYLVVPGLLVTAVWLWRKRATPAGPMLLALSIHHVGVLAFSVVDFQRYGDLAVLLQTFAFFVAVAINGAHGALVSGLERRSAIPVRAVSDVAVLFITLGISLPGPLAERRELAVPGVEPGTVLADQQDVADQIAAEFGDQKLVFLRYAEIPYLMRYVNPVPFVFWNVAAASFAREGDESVGRTLQRILREADPDAYTSPRGRVKGVPGYRTRTFVSRSGRYRVDLQVRARGDAASRPGDSSGPELPGDRLPAGSD